MYALIEIPRALSQDVSRAGNTAYIIVVPGFSRDDLAQQTCSHFEAFVQKLAQSQNTHTKIYVFQHDIRAETFKSWDQFAEAGSGFMEALNNLRGQGELLDADDLLLIGHGLGGFIVKKALVTAHRKLRHSKYVFEVLAMLIMLGVPQLELENKSDWIRLISACVPKHRKLPSNLLDEESVLSLKAICDRFESFTIASPLVRVWGSLDPKPKVNLSLKKRSRKVQGCISAATAVVREFTTSDPERQIWDENGSHGSCALSEDSAHHHMLIAWTNEARQNFDLEANSDPIDAPPARAEVIPQLTGSANTQAAAVPLQIMDISEPFDYTCLSEPTGESSAVINSSEDDPETPLDVVNSLEESTRESLGDEALSENSSVSSTAEIENLPSCSGVDFVEPLVDTPNTSSLKPYNGPLLPFTYLPLSRDPSFFSNNDTLQAIQDHLIISVTTQTPQHQISKNHSRVCILHGIGGIGKSSIALETAYRTLDQFDCVFWIGADSNYRVSTEIHNIAVKMNILEGSARRDYSKSLSTFLNWIQQSGTRSLLIYDDIESFRLIQRILPSSSNVSVIITTRDYTMSKVFTRASSSTWLKAIEIHPFSLDEASMFLHQLAKNCSEADDPSACRILATKLSGSPLAIRQMAGLVNRRHLTFAEFLELYEWNQETADIMPVSRGRISKRESYSSTDKIYDTYFRCLSKPAVALLNVVSFLHPENIAESILTSAQRFTRVPLEDFPRTVLAYTSARTELWNTSFCRSVINKRRLTTHRMTQEQMRLRLSSEELNAGFQTASFLLLSQWPSKKKFRSGCLGNWPEFEDLQCHVYCLAKVYNNVNAVATPNLDKKITAPDSFVQVLVYSSWYHWQRGSLSEGKPLFDLACDILTDSSIKSAHSQRLEVIVPQTTFTFEGVEGLLTLVSRNERIDSEKPNANSYHDMVGNMAHEERNLPETPNSAVMKAHSSAQWSERNSAKGNIPSNVGREDLEGDFHLRYHTSAQREQIADDGSKEGQTLDPEQDLHADAHATLEKGLSLIAEQKYFQAIGSLMAIKDSVSAFQGATSQKYQIYLSASRNIGILYWLNENMDLSLQTLLHTLSLYQDMAKKGDQDSLLHGQILFALGNVHLKTGNARQSLSNFSQALGIFESIDDKGSDWIAVTRLKLADLHIQEQQHNQAHTLLQQCLSHFQSQSTLSAQAQTVRAIHQQALLYEVEGNKTMARVFHAAAREGRAEYRRAKGIPDPEAGMPFEQKDLEADIEFWFR